MRVKLTISQNIRFADRDITMRYHWGLGIGHTYSHDQKMPSQKHSILEASIVSQSVDQGHEDIDENQPESLDTPCSDAQTSVGPNGKTVQDEKGNDSKDSESEGDSEPEEQDHLDYVDLRAQSQVDSDSDSIAGDDFDRYHSDRNDEDYLELYETYHND